MTTHPSTEGLIERLREAMKLRIRGVDDIYNGAFDNGVRAAIAAFDAEALARFTQPKGGTDGNA